MARPRAATYDDQRSQILKAAADLFARRGYTAATLNEVASASGVSKATLYHYFSDKHALLEDIVSSHVARLQGIAAEAGAPSIEPPGSTQGATEARLRRLVRRFMQAYADAQSEHRVLTEDVKFLDERARGAVLDGQRQVVAAFAQGIAACRPDMRTDLHKPMAMLLFGMINWTFTWLRPDGVLTHADLGDIVVDLFFGGLPAVTAGLPLARAPSLASSQAQTPPAGLR
jgi:TetR/AcrR family transcriptional regulator